MFQTEWPVLIVDDDPDVIAVSKLAMKNFIIDGVPIKLFAASSKAEAIETLRQARRRGVAVHQRGLHRRGDGVPIKPVSTFAGTFGKR